MLACVARNCPSFGFRNLPSFRRSRSKSRSKGRSKKHKKRSGSVDKKKKRSRSKSKRKEKKVKKEKKASRSKSRDRKSRDPSPQQKEPEKPSPKQEKTKQEESSSKSAKASSRSRSQSPKRSRSKQRNDRRSRSRSRSRSRRSKKDHKKKDRSSRRSRSRSPRRRSSRSGSRGGRRRSSRSKSPRNSGRAKSGRKLAFDPEALNGALAIASGVLNGTANPAAASALLMQQMQCANPQATRQARRLYIGNMPTGAGITESMLLEFFTTTVISLGITTTQPVLSVWCSSEGTFCFVEFRSIKDATTCLSLLQGITLGGRVLNVGRPADYKAPPSYLENFVVGLSPDAYVLPPPAPNGPVGLLGLKLPLPGMPHVVPSTPASVPPTALGLTMLPSAGTTATLPAIAPPTSEVLMLVNMIEEQELLENEEFEDLVLDVREECERYGPVEEIVIPRALPTSQPSDGSIVDIEGKLPNTKDSGPRVGQGVGRIFARFTSSDSCVKAKNAIDGRLFNNNRVGASFWDLNKFNSKIYV